MATDEAAKKLQALTIINETLKKENEEVRALRVPPPALLTRLHPPGVLSCGESSRTAAAALTRRLRTWRYDSSELVRCAKR